MTVTSAGLLALAAVQTNLPLMLKKLGMIPTGRSDIGSVNRARNQLLKKGLLEREGNHLRITPRGEALLHAHEIRGIAHLHKRRWDGRWRVLIFDIPEERKIQREGIRRSLSAVGFTRLQDSVWIYPHDVEEFVALLKADFKVGKDMLYMIVDELESDAPLREHFGLSVRS